jgi:FMN reductase
MTDKKLKVLGISGSLRKDSRTDQALEIALQGAAMANGVDSDMLDLKSLALPLFDDREDVNTYPSSVFTLLNKVREADALIFATPVYQGTMSAAMKNVFDTLELLENDKHPWLQNKVVGLISVAGGEKNVNTINDMQNVCRVLRAWILPTIVAVPGKSFENGKVNEKNKIKLLNLGKEVGTYTTRFSKSFSVMQ